MEGYRDLGFAVLKNAVYEYYEKIRYYGLSVEEAEKYLNINEVWFDVTGINEEWFKENLRKRGKQIWQERKR